MKKEGYLIAIYGINNLGKTTQAKKLVEFLNKNNWAADYVKYPVYRTKPSGTIINQVLRKDLEQNITEEEFQMWYTINRFQYEPIILKKMEQGHIVVAEDYIGTGVAWGATKGANMDWLVDINKPLRQEDLAILFDGERFIDGKEKKHIHEQDDVLMARCRKWHQKLSEMNGWKVVNANQRIDEVHEDVLEIVSQFLRGSNIWKEK
ncbi:hypothetical protein KKG41_00550 [Patescibacteria group bacterium]|nr:hypothetical protein [Patescibacteria group bacterium]MBU1890301.1 hypothetical protein [Patescibacteria group bacterium]